MNVSISETEKELAIKVAQDIAEYINKNPNALLCLAAGDTPLAAYAELVALQEKGEVDLSSVYYVGLDEWVGLGRETVGSCIQVMEDHYYIPARINSNRIVVWNGLYSDIDVEIGRIENWIKKHGGVAYTVLGIGMNGHVGFNEPGIGIKDGGFKVTLDNITCNVSTKYFDTSIAVKYGVGIGIGEFVKAEKVVLMASGERKAKIIETLLTGGRTNKVPVSLLKDHKNMVLYLDKAACGK